MWMADQTLSYSVNAGGEKPGQDVTNTAECYKQEFLCEGFLFPAVSSIKASKGPLQQQHLCPLGRLMDP